MTSGRQVPVLLCILFICGFASWEDILRGLQDGQPGGKQVSSGQTGREKSNSDLDLEFSLFGSGGHKLGTADVRKFDPSLSASNDGPFGRDVSLFQKGGSSQLSGLFADLEPSGTQTSIEQSSLLSQLGGDVYGGSEESSLDLSLRLLGGSQDERQALRKESRMPFGGGARDVFGQAQQQRRAHQGDASENGGANHQGGTSQEEVELLRKQVQLLQEQVRLQQMQQQMSLQQQHIPHQQQMQNGFGTGYSPFTPTSAAGRSGFGVGQNGFEHSGPSSYGPSSFGSNAGFQPGSSPASYGPTPAGFGSNPTSFGSNPTSFGSNAGVYGSPHAPASFMGSSQHSGFGASTQAGFSPTHPNGGGFATQQNFGFESRPGYGSGQPLYSQPLGTSPYSTTGGLGHHPGTPGHQPLVSGQPASGVNSFQSSSGQYSTNSGHFSTPEGQYAAMGGEGGLFPTGQFLPGQFPQGPYSSQGQYSSQSPQSISGLHPSAGGSLPSSVDSKRPVSRQSGLGNQSNGLGNASNGWTTSSGSSDMNSLGGDLGRNPSVWDVVTVGGLSGNHIPGNQMSFLAGGGFTFQEQGLDGQSGRSSVRGSSGSRGSDYFEGNSVDQVSMVDLKGSVVDLKGSVVDLKGSVVDLKGLGMMEPPMLISKGPGGAKPPGNSMPPGLSDNPLATSTVSVDSQVPANGGELVFGNLGSVVTSFGIESAESSAGSHVVDSVVSSNPVGDKGRDGSSKPGKAGGGLGKQESQVKTDVNGRPEMQSGVKEDKALSTAAASQSRTQQQPAGPTHQQPGPTQQQPAGVKAPSGKASVASGEVKAPTKEVRPLTEPVKPLTEPVKPSTGTKTTPVPAPGASSATLQGKKSGSPPQEDSANNSRSAPPKRSTGKSAQSTGLDESILTHEGVVTKGKPRAAVSETKPSEGKPSEGRPSGKAQPVTAKPQAVSAKPAAIPGGESSSSAGRAPLVSNDSILVEKGQVKKPAAASEVSSTSSKSGSGESVSSEPTASQSRRPKGPSQALPSGPNTAQHESILILESQSDQETKDVGVSDTKSVRASDAKGGSEIKGASDSLGISDSLGTSDPRKATTRTVRVYRLRPETVSSDMALPGSVSSLVDSIVGSDSGSAGYFAFEDHEVAIAQEPSSVDENKGGSKKKKKKPSTDPESVSSAPAFVPPTQLTGAALTSAVQSFKQKLSTIVGLLLTMHSEPAEAKIKKGSTVPQPRLWVESRALVTSFVASTPVSVTSERVKIPEVKAALGSCLTKLKALVESAIPLLNSGVRFRKGVSGRVGTGSEKASASDAEAAVWVDLLPDDLVSVVSPQVLKSLEDRRVKENKELGQLGKEAAKAALKEEALRRKLEAEERKASAGAGVVAEDDDDEDKDKGKSKKGNKKDDKGAGGKGSADSKGSTDGKGPADSKGSTDGKGSNGKGKGSGLKGKKGAVPAPPPEMSEEEKLKAVLATLAMHNSGQVVQPASLTGAQPKTTGGTKSNKHDKEPRGISLSNSQSGSVFSISGGELGGYSNPPGLGGSSHGLGGSASSLSQKLSQKGGVQVSQNGGTHANVANGGSHVVSYSAAPFKEENTIVYLVTARMTSFDAGTSDGFSDRFVQANIYMGSQSMEHVTRGLAIAGFDFPTYIAESLNVARPVEDRYLRKLAEQKREDGDEGGGETASKSGEPNSMSGEPNSKSEQPDPVVYHYSVPLVSPSSSRDEIVARHEAASTMLLEYLRVKSLPFLRSSELSLLDRNAVLAAQKALPKNAPSVDSYNRVKDAEFSFCEDSEFQVCIDNVNPAVIEEVASTFGLVTTLYELAEEWAKETGLEDKFAKMMKDKLAKGMKTVLGEVDGRDVSRDVYVSTPPFIIAQLTVEVLHKSEHVLLLELSRDPNEYMSAFDFGYADILADHQKYVYACHESALVNHYEMLASRLPAAMHETRINRAELISLVSISANTVNPHSLAFRPGTLGGNKDYIITTGRDWLEPAGERWLSGLNATLQLLALRLFAEVSLSTSFTTRRPVLHAQYAAMSRVVAILGTARHFHSNVLQTLDQVVEPHPYAKVRGYVHKIDHPLGRNRQNGPAKIHLASNLPMHFTSVKDVVYSITPQTAENAKILRRAKLLDLCYADLIFAPNYEQGLSTLGTHGPMEAPFIALTNPTAPPQEYYVVQIRSEPHVPSFGGPPITRLYNYAVSYDVAQEVLELMQDTIQVYEDEFSADAMQPNLGFITEEVDGVPIERGGVFGVCGPSDVPNVVSRLKQILATNGFDHPNELQFKYGSVDVFVVRSDELQLVGAMNAYQKLLTNQQSIGELKNFALQIMKHLSSRALSMHLNGFYPLCTGHSSELLEKEGYIGSWAGTQFGCYAGTKNQRDQTLHNEVVQTPQLFMETWEEVTDSAWVALRMINTYVDAVSAYENSVEELETAEAVKSALSTAFKSSNLSAESSDSLAESSELLDAISANGPSIAAAMTAAVSNKVVNPYSDIRQFLGARRSSLFERENRGEDHDDDNYDENSESSEELEADQPRRVFSGLLGDLSSLCDNLAPLEALHVLSIAQFPTYNSRGAGTLQFVGFDLTDLTQFADDADPEDHAQRPLPPAWYVARMVMVNFWVADAIKKTNYGTRSPQDLIPGLRNEAERSGRLALATFMAGVEFVEKHPYGRLACSMLMDQVAARSSSSSFYVIVNSEQYVYDAEKEQYTETTTYDYTGLALHDALPFLSFLEVLVDRQGSVSRKNASHRKAREDMIAAAEAEARRLNDGIDDEMGKMVDADSVLDKAKFALGDNSTAAGNSAGGRSKKLIQSKTEALFADWFLGIHLVRGMMTVAADNQIGSELDDEVDESEGANPSAQEVAKSQDAELDTKKTDSRQVASSPAISMSSASQPFLANYPCIGVDSLPTRSIRVKIVRVDVPNSMLNSLGIAQAAAEVLAGKVNDAQDTYSIPSNHFVAADVKFVCPVATIPTQLIAKSA